MLNHRHHCRAHFMHRDECDCHARRDIIIRDEKNHVFGDCFLSFFFFFVLYVLYFTYILSLLTFYVFSSFFFSDLTKRTCALTSTYGNMNLPRFTFSLRLKLATSGFVEISLSLLIAQRTTYNT